MSNHCQPSPRPENRSQPALYPVATRCSGTDCPPRHPERAIRPQQVVTTGNILPSPEHEIHESEHESCSIQGLTSTNFGLTLGCVIAAKPETQASGTEVYNMDARGTFKRGTNAGTLRCADCKRTFQSANIDGSTGLCTFDRDGVINCYEKAGDENAVSDGLMTDDEFWAKYGKGND